MITTDHDQTDDELLELLGRTMRAVADAAPDLAVEASAPDRRWMAVAAAVAAVGLAGGGWMATRAGNDTPLPTLDPNDTRPTLEEFRFTDEEQLVLYNASERMLRDCMATKGQIYTIASVDNWYLGAEALDDLWFIGRTDARRAETIGYSPMDGNFPVNNNVDRSSEAAWEVAFSGASAGDAGDEEYSGVVDPIAGTKSNDGGQLSSGCFGDVQRLLFDDQATFIGLNDYVANRLDGGSIDIGALNDPRLAPFIRSWSDCVAAAGHERYESPLDPVNDFGSERAFDDPTSTPSADEVATAVDDVACKQSTGLLEMARVLRDAYSREAAARAPDIVAEHRRFIDRAVAHAHGFDAGDLAGSWRTSPRGDALRNTDDCAWLPSEVTSLDMSAGERQELANYLEHLSRLARERNAQLGAGASVRTSWSAADVPPWLLGQSTCTSDVAADQIALLQSALPSPNPS